MSQCISMNFVMNNTKKIEWILRIAMFGEFLGHGVLALQLKPRFIEMLDAFPHITSAIASKLLIIIGAGDIIVAVLSIIFPFRAMLLAASIWGFWTALARTMSGDPIWDFVERWANWGVPLALLFLRRFPKDLKEFFR